MKIQGSGEVNWGRSPRWGWSPPAPSRQSPLLSSVSSLGLFPTKLRLASVLPAPLGHILHPPPAAPREGHILHHPPRPSSSPGLSGILPVASSSPGSSEHIPATTDRRADRTVSAKLLCCSSSLLAAHSPPALMKLFVEALIYCESLLLLKASPRREKTKQKHRSLSRMVFLHSNPKHRLPRWLSGKESACNAGDAGSIPGSGSSLGGGHGNPLQYSCLENPMDGEPGRLQSIGSHRAGHG